MATRQRFAAAPIVALGLAFVVVLAMGHLISSSPSTADPSPTTTEPPPSRPSGPPTRESETAGSLTLDLGPIVASAMSSDVEPSDDPDLAGLEVEVRRVDADQVLVCLRLPRGWRMGTGGWTPTGGRVHCRDASPGDDLRVTVERER